MDEKKSNIRLVKTGGRKVTRTTTEYNPSTADKKNSASQSRKTPARNEGRELSELEKKVRYQKKQKEQRLKLQRRRALATLILAVLLVLVLMFLTPIFNIRSVTVEGNRLVSAEQFQEKLQPLVGENLFRSGGGKIRKLLKEIPYIDEVEVQKKIFPPSVKVIVTEYTPAALIKTENNTLLTNAGLRVLSEDGSAPEPVPVITGFSVSGYSLGEILETDESEKKDIVITVLETLENAEILDEIIEIDVNDITDITMNYDNRITVLCGTQLDLERKLRLFKEAMRSNSLAENARGTMDLSETGQATYTP